MANIQLKQYCITSSSASKNTEMNCTKIMT